MKIQETKRQLRNQLGERLRNQREPPKDGLTTSSYEKADLPAVQCQFPIGIH